MSTMSSVPNESIIILVRDLMFSSKITATANALNVSTTLVRDPAKLIGQSGRRLIIDLNMVGAIEAASGWMKTNSGDVIGFVAHTDAETISRARSANISRVLARSQFVQ